MCEDEGGGTWYGPGTTQKSGVLTSCCAVAKYVNSPDQTNSPVHQFALRNKLYKLVQIESIDCKYSKPVTSSNPPPPYPWAEYYTVTSKELYKLTPKPKNPKGLDNKADNLVAQGCPNYIPGQTDPSTCLTGADKQNYLALNNELQTMFRDAKAQNRCAKLGDGNMDRRVNQQDVENWKQFNGKGPSRYDINLDGQTDEKDLAIIKAHLGTDCMTVCERADLDRDGKVQADDMALAAQTARRLHRSDLLRRRSQRRRQGQWRGRAHHAVGAEELQQVARRCAAGLASIRLSSRASVSETRDPVLRVLSMAAEYWVPAFAGRRRRRLLLRRVARLRRRRARRAQDGAEADMRGAEIGFLRLARGRPVARAEIRRAQP